MTGFTATRSLPDISGSVSPHRLAHIVFRTNDMPRMIDWYSDVFGAHVVFQTDKIAFLTYDDEHHRIALIASESFAEKPDGTTVGFYHAAFTFADLGTLLATYRRLASRDVWPRRSIHHGPTVSFYYQDPDLNDIEMQVDVFDTADAATDWMRGSVFSANPIGTEFDPEELIVRYESGESIEALMRRADDQQ